MTQELSDMTLVRIKHRLVEANPDQYNSTFHSEAEAPGLEIPSEAPYAYNRWLELIRSSQASISSGCNLEIQHVLLSPQQGRLLLMASEASIHTGALNRVYAEELFETITPSLAPLDFGSEGLFLRLDAASPKDGVPGNLPLRSVNDILLRVTTSHRARNSIRDLIETRSESINLWFLPYNRKMNTALEYRVFCAPPHGHITAISQYKWHQPSIFHDRSEGEVSRIMERIWEEAGRIHCEIMAEVKAGIKESTDGMEELLLKQGFSFDVMFDESVQLCALIELNSFGARSGCGACLFHWLRDMEVLYGKPAEGRSSGVREVEFRISI